VIPPARKVAAGTNRTPPIRSVTTKRLKFPVRARTARLMIEYAESPTARLQLTIEKPAWNGIDSGATIVR
jgi:hypothetical protein